MAAIAQPAPSRCPPMPDVTTEALSREGIAIYVVDGNYLLLLEEGHPSGHGPSTDAWIPRCWTLVQKRLELPEADLEPYGLVPGKMESGHVLRRLDGLTIAARGLPALAYHADSKVPAGPARYVALVPPAEGDPISIAISDATRLLGASMGLANLGDARDAAEDDSSESSTADPEDLIHC